MGLGTWCFQASPPSRDQVPSPPAPGTHLGAQLLLLLGRKFRATVERDIHLGHNLTNPPLHGLTLICRQEPFQHQESILLKLQADMQETQVSPHPQTSYMRADLTPPQTRSRLKAGPSISFIALPPSLAMVSMSSEGQWVLAAWRGVEAELSHCNPPVGFSHIGIQPHSFTQPPLTVRLPCTRHGFRSCRFSHEQAIHDACLPKPGLRKEIDIQQTSIQGSLLHKVCFISLEYNTGDRKICTDMGICSRYSMRLEKKVKGLPWWFSG